MSENPYVKKGLSKQSCSAYIRSTAISVYHEVLDSAPIGKNPKGKRLMTGIWDVGVVPKYLNDLPSNKILWQKELSQKLPMFSTLAAVRRWSKIWLLSFNYIIRKTIVLAFFEKFTKTWRKNKAPPLLDF